MTILRALAASIKLPERLPQTSGRSTYVTGGGLLSSGSQSGMQAYKEVGAAYGPIRRIAQSAALTNWSLYQQTADKGKTDRDLIDDATAPARHPGTALWTRPNPFMSRRFFVFLTEMWKIQAGGVYWVIVKGGTSDSPFLQRGVDSGLELWPIREERITPIPDPENYLAGYVYTLGTQQIPLSIQSVIPIGWPDPTNPLKFAGPLQSIMTDLEAERYASQYNRNTFLNDARPGGVIEFDAPLPRDRFEELVLRWREQHQGLNNAKRVAIIEGGHWIDSKNTNAEMEYEKLRHLSRETVMFALGMPFAMMQTNDVNLANAQMAEKLFFRWTLRPELEDLKEPLNERALPYLGDRLTVDYELPAPEDEAFDVFASSTGWLSGTIKRNEARAGMGFDADPDWDGYINDLPGAVPQKPPTLPPARFPRTPTHLSYRAKAERDERLAAHEATLAEQAAPLEDTWAKRLQQVRQGYLDLVAARNGTH